MRRLIKKIVPAFHSITASFHGYQKPRFTCRDKARSADFEVFVPGVEAGAVELSVTADDELIVTARKALPVRPNFQAANIEAVQHHYQLRVQLGDQVDTKSIWAALRDGILTIHLKKTAPAALQFSVA
jgi:HSP20 family molecular chaperone IbpA